MCRLTYGYLLAVRFRCGLCCDTMTAGIDTKTLSLTIGYRFFDLA